MLVLQVKSIVGASDLWFDGISNGANASSASRITVPTNSGGDKNSGLFFASLLRYYFF